MTFAKGIILAAWERGTIPSAWKYAEVAPLYKAGKDHLAAASYRPVSLVPMGYRIYGRLLKWLLMDKVGGLIPRNQFGFRPGRQAQMQIAAMAELHNRGTPRHTALLDIEKAYDTVPRDMLIRKLVNMEVGRELAAAIKATLERHG